MKSQLEKYEIGCNNIIITNFSIVHCQNRNTYWAGFTESLNNRMVEVERPFWIPSCWTSLVIVTYSQLPRMGFATHVSFQYLQGRESTTTLSNLWLWSVTLTVRKFFLIFRGNFLCFSLYTLYLVLSLDTTKNSLAASALHPPFTYLNILIKHLMSFLFSQPNSHRYLTVSKQDRCFMHQPCSWPFFGLFPICPCLHISWGCIPNLLNSSNC